MADKFGVASLLKTACSEWTCAHNASSKPRRHSGVVTTWRSSISGWYQVVLCASICVVVAAVLCVRDPRLNARRGVVAPARRVFRSNLSESVVDDYNITACDRTKLRRRSVGVRIVCVCVCVCGRTVVWNWGVMLERCLSDRHCASLADCVAILTDAGHLPPPGTPAARNLLSWASAPG